MTNDVMNDHHARLLPVREAADFIGVHPGTLRKWSDERLIPCYRLGRRRDRRFDRTDLAKFLTGEKEPWSATNEALAS